MLLFAFVLPPPPSDRTNTALLTGRGQLPDNATCQGGPPMDPDVKACLQRHAYTSRNVPDRNSTDSHLNRNLTVGYVVSAWPRLSETFILNEVIAVERLGVELRIFSTKDPTDELVHAKVAQVRAPVTSLSIKRNWKMIWWASIRLLKIGRASCRERV